MATIIRPAEGLKTLVVEGMPPGAVLDAWNEFLPHAGFASHYGFSGYFLEPYFKGLRPFAVLAMDSDRVEGVVTGIKSGGRVICGLGVRPQAAVREGADLVAVSRSLAEGLKSHLDAGDRLVIVQGWSPLPGFEDAGFRRCDPRSRGDQRTVMLDLSLGTNALFKQCSEKRRNEIRRAIKAGIVVEEFDETRDFDECHQIQCDWNKFKDVETPDKETTKKAFRLKESRLVLVARQEGRIVAFSSFRHQAGGVMEYAANSSRREETKDRPNDLLVWKAVEWAAEHKMRWFSMAGDHFFLRRFGGYLHESSRYMLDRSTLRVNDMREMLLDARAGAKRLIPAKPLAFLKRRISKRGNSSFYG